MNHRIFVAITPPLAIKSKLLGTIAELKKWELPVRFVTESNLHLTLKFLDSRTDKEMELIDQVLQETLANEKSFILTLGGVKIFPSKDVARVISAELLFGQRLRKIEEKISQRLNQLTFLPKENRQFKSHITLARIREDLKSQMIKKIERLPLEGRWKVNSLELIESDLSGKIPHYTVISHYSLINES